MDDANKQAVTKDDKGDEDLEQLTNWDGLKLVKYKGFYIPLQYLKNVVYFEKHFKARDEDIIVASYPKSGMTWLKALTFSIAKRDIYDPMDPSHHPLLTTHSHNLVPSLHFEDFEQVVERSCPRIYGAHIGYNVLLQSVHESKCKIIYICRNPLDQFVSYYHFSQQNFAKNGDSLLALNEALDLFCEGIGYFGPIWDHILSYWNAHVKNPEKVLFLNYENLKDDTVCCVRKIAEFIGIPFSIEEDERGVPEKITRLCSFENLSNLEVNKKGINCFVKVKSLFRKGIVGDWRNYLTPEMAQRIETITANKFEGSGLTF